MNQAAFRWNKNSSSRVWVKLNGKNASQIVSPFVKDVSDLKIELQNKNPSYFWNVTDFNQIEIVQPLMSSNPLHSHLLVKDILSSPKHPLFVDPCSGTSGYKDAIDTIDYEPPIGCTGGIIS